MSYVNLYVHVMYMESRCERAEYTNPTLFTWYHEVSAWDSTLHAPM